MTEDAALAFGLARGDRAAARQVYESHGRALLRFGVAMSDCVATAEDVVHDTFIELLRRPTRYDPERGSLRTYLYGIARHQLAKRLRSSLPRLNDEPDEAWDVDRLPETELAAAQLLRMQVTLEEQADRAQNIERIRAAILTLPFVYREVIAWCDLEELPYATVAAILKCPIGTVRSRLHRARALLATHLVALCGNADSPAQPRGAPARSQGDPPMTLTAAFPAGETST